MNYCKHKNCEITREQKLSDVYSVSNGNPYHYGDCDDHHHTGVVEVNCHDCFEYFRFTNEKQYPQWLKRYIEEAGPF